MQLELDLRDLQFVHQALDLGGGHVLHVTVRDSQPFFRLLAEERGARSCRRLIVFSRSSSSAPFLQRTQNQPGELTLPLNVGARAGAALSAHRRAASTQGNILCSRIVCDQLFEPLAQPWHVPLTAIQRKK